MNNFFRVKLIHDKTYIHTNKLSNSESLVWWIKIQWENFTNYGIHLRERESESESEAFKYCLTIISDHYYNYNVCVYS